MEEVILVDADDNVIGRMEKMAAHRQAKLHRAFSVFIFNNKKQLLLQQRAFHKYHSGGLWTNTCCSHPKPDESVEEAAHRRLKEEMGFDCKLQKIFHFIYCRPLDNQLTEHELDHVFIGFYDDKPKINKEEVENYQWINPVELFDSIKNNPSLYTEWFKIILLQHKEKLFNLINNNEF